MSARHECPWRDKATRVGEFRTAFRTLQRRRGFAAAAVATLAPVRRAVPADPLVALRDL